MGYFSLMVTRVTLIPTHKSACFPYNHSKEKRFSIIIIIIIIMIEDVLYNLMYTFLKNFLRVTKTFKLKRNTLSVRHQC